MTQHPAARTPYLIKSPKTWKLVRTGYMRGQTAPVLAERYGVGEGNIRRRARLEGWTRRALAQAEGERLRAAPQLAPGPSATAAASPVVGGLDLAQGVRDRDDGGDGAELAETDPLGAARTLLRRAASSAVAGRLGRAQEAVKLAEGLARAAAALGLDEGEAWDDDDEAPRLTPEQLEALREDVERRYARFDRPEEGEASAESAWSWEAAGASASGRDPRVAGRRTSSVRSDRAGVAGAAVGLAARPARRRSGRAPGRRAR